MTVRFVSHTADVQFIVRAPTKAKLFEECARAFSLCVAEGKKVSPSEKKTIALSGGDDLSLLYRFMDELVFFVDGERFLVSDARVSLVKNELKATCKGIHLARSEGFRHVKAATYSEMYVKKQKGGWEARVVLDV